jgi:heme-degrading monooxygenase HmoA
MAELYTLATWMVKPGREDKFVTAWREMGERTLEDFPGAHGTLLQETETGRFVSFGPWESEEQIAEWRASPAFQEGVGKMQALLDGFEPGTYRLRADIGG